MSWDMEFRRKILDRHQKEILQYCYQCSRCVKECPAAKALGEDVETTAAEKKAGITKLRGSVYQYTDLRGRVCKVIPTIHPAWFLYAGGFNSKKQRRAIKDWERIRRESSTKHLQRRERIHVTNPSDEES